MKKLLFLSLFCLSATLCAKSYESDLKNFFHRTEDLLDLNGQEKLLNLSSSFKPLDGSYNAGIALLPDDPTGALRNFRNCLEPGSKALIVFYPSDEGFHKITTTLTPNLSLSLQDFRDIAHTFGFEVLHSELKRHFAYFKNKQSLDGFVSKYLKREVEEKCLAKIFTNGDVKIPTKLAVILIRKPSQSAELKK